MPEQEVTIAISNDYLNRTDEVASACEELGMRITQRLPASGILIGFVDPATLPVLRQMPSIAAVEPARGYQLPPSDSDIQ